MKNTIQEKHTHGVVQTLLGIASGLYRFGVWMANRLRAPTKQLPCKVISIGNITAGGTGKTPMTLYVAEMLQKFGYTVVILSRGYKGSAGKKGAFVSDGQRVFLTPSEAGDEPYMMAHAVSDIPVVVSHDRYKGGQMAIEKFHPDVILLDDGFQHQALYRDVNIVLLDATHPFGSGYLLPKGTLREPVRGLQRADAIIYTRAEKLPFRKEIGFVKPFFSCRQAPFLVKAHSAEKNIDMRKFISLDAIKGKRVIAFAGIAHNHQFVEMLRKYGGDVLDIFFYSDHHSYTQKEISGISQKATQKNVDAIVTTQKDIARLGFVNPFEMSLYIVGISLDFGPDKEPFEELLLHQMGDTPKGVLS